jgi:thioredoxin 1
MRKLIGLAALFSLLLLTTRAFTAGDSASVPEAPVKGMVTMVDVGSDRCIPCKMMAPVLRELKKECEGKAAILFVDIWKQPKESSKFNVRVIPTQIFFDRDGKEFYRHEGYLNAESALAVLEKAGVAVVAKDKHMDTVQN